MPEAHLTSGERQMRAGFEQYTFSVSSLSARAIAKCAKRGDLELNMYLCSLYMFPDKPHPEDIVSKRITPGKRQIEIEMVLKRGHMALAEFIRAHKHGKVEFHMGNARCTKCETSVFLSPDSFPSERGTYSET